MFYVKLFYQSHNINYLIINKRIEGVQSYIYNIYNVS